MDKRIREQVLPRKVPERDGNQEAATVYSRIQSESRAGEPATTSMIHRWREEFNQNVPVLFGDKHNPKAKAQAQGYPPGESPDDLKRIIGDLTVQNDILKKVQGLLDR